MDQRKYIKAHIPPRRQRASAFIQRIYSHVVQKETGKTVSEYVNQEKMRLAKQILLQEDYELREIAAQLGEKKEAVLHAMEAIVEPISLYEPVYNDGADAIYVMDQLSDDKNTDEDWIEEISLKEAIKKLGSREKHILNLRFFKGRTQMEVSEELGISQAQVSRLEKSALAHMKKYI